MEIDAQSTAAVPVPPCSCAPRGPQLAILQEDPSQWTAAVPAPPCYPSAHPRTCYQSAHSECAIQVHTQNVLSKCTVYSCTTLAPPISCTSCTCAPLVHHLYSCAHLVHLYSRAPNSCTTNLVHLSCTAVLHSYHCRAPLTSFLNCRGTSCGLTVGTSTRVPSCTTPQSRAPLCNLVHLSCTAVLHSYHSRALLSCTPHKLPQLSWHFALPGRQIPHSRNFLNSRAQLKYS